MLYTNRHLASREPVIRNASCLILLVLMVLSAAMRAESVGTSFTYQGELQQGGVPANQTVFKDSFETSPPPECEVRLDGTTWCENGMLRVRNSESGITWFDVFHPTERIWYVNKNNLNLHVSVPGEGFINTELGQVQATVTVLSTSATEITANHQFAFDHGAIVNLELTMTVGVAQATFVAHLDALSAPVNGFIWQVSFGQAEAVDQLHFAEHDIDVHALPQPFPGGSLEVQHVQWYGPLSEQEFLFSGVETATADPANPAWMTRVLGLQQHITWHIPMRANDNFAFEARDRPWQPTWGIPEAIPWIEGLWFVRVDSFLDGDQLTYGIDAYDDLD